MAPFYGVERDIYFKTKIKEVELARGRHIYPGKPTVVNIVSGEKARIREVGKERTIEIIPSNSEPQQLVKSQDRTKVVKGTTIFTTNDYGKNLSIEWRDK